MSRILITYPIPMSDFYTGSRMPILRVPQDITRREADRVKALVESLVIEPTAEEVGQPLSRAEASD